MTILKSQIFGGSSIGIYLAANNRFVLYPRLLLKPIIKKFKSVFDEPLYPLTINNSNLIGVYTASNKYGVIVPTIIKDEEIKAITSYLNGSVEIGVLKSIDNAFGNLILCNDKGAIISSLLKGNRKQIEDVLNVETIIYEFAGSYLPGSISLANNYGCVVHPLTTDDEIEEITSILKVDETDVSTINRGIPYLSAGAIINDKNGIFGQDSTGPEMMRLTNVLKL
ncbi:MAG: translation initiation factor IF-6 [Candidatus Hermodarchaeota archaeon]